MCKVRLKFMHAKTREEVSIINRKKITENKKRVHNVRYAQQISFNFTAYTSWPNFPLQHDLYCVGWGVTPYSLTHSLDLIKCDVTMSSFMRMYVCVYVFNLLKTHHNYTDNMYSKYSELDRLGSKRALTAACDWSLVQSSPGRPLYRNGLHYSLFKYIIFVYYLCQRTNK